MFDTNATPMEDKKSYYIVMTSEVYDDERVSDSALRLYGHIARYAAQEGYCWASNAKLAEDCKKSERAVRDAMKLLEDCGHIWRDADEAGRRRIWIRKPVSANCQGGGEILPGGAAENCHQNNTSIIIPPYNPPKKRAEELEHWFGLFWQEYPKKVDKQDAHDKFMRLAPDRPLMVVIWRALKRQKRSEQWQERRFIPSPRRWIGKRLWEDEVDVPPGSSSSAVVEEGEVTYW